MPLFFISINDLAMQIEEKPLAVPVSNIVIGDFVLKSIKYLERQEYNILP